MKYSIRFNGELKGTIRLPASKSISNRALIISALSGNLYEIQNLSDCDDTKIMIDSLASDAKTIDVGAAGTAMRFLTAYFAMQQGERVITGTERMKNRPIRILVDALNAVGAGVRYMEKAGFPPLLVKGSCLKGGTVDLNGEVSSQYISALMMIAPLMSEGLVLHLKPPVISQPYIRMTVQLMETFGIGVQWTENTILIPPQPYKPVLFKVENDWSAASYWYEMMLLAPGSPVINLPGLNQTSLQGDANGRKLFERLGVATAFTEEGILLSKKQTQVDRLDYHFADEPDLVQTFVVACALKQVPFRFTGLQSLRIKETDRIAALQKEMKKLGFVIHCRDDNQLEWSGERCEAESLPSIDTYEDHRMAMAFAPAAIVFDAVTINAPSVVSKSYPQFWEELETAGFLIEETE
ncbi:MAG: 3-phosphoshikimate 1-carboxyvinyltransferase [Dysgonamonadaceae bacterium]|nr:3-phosphoshikimate 1-carboxyvinyltransferase [Dysgonamonadaceae bacterium]